MPPRVLKGKGKHIGLWIDKTDYHWLRIEGVKHGGMSSLIRKLIKQAKEL